MSPALGLALLFILIGAQTARVVSRRRLPYPWMLLLAAVGLFGAELLAVSIHLGGPTLGVLHPVADAIGMGLCEGAALALTPSRRRLP